MIAGGVYNSGRLADPKPGARYNYAPVPEATLARAIALRDRCAENGVPLKAAALQMPLLHPAICSVVIGAATPEEIAENVAMSQVPIPAELWKDLRESGLLDLEAPAP